MGPQWHDSEDDLNDKVDPFTTQLLDPTRPLNRCACGVYFQDCSYEAIQRDRAGKCSVCESTAIHLVSWSRSRNANTSPGYIPPRRSSVETPESGIEDFFGTIVDYISGVFRLLVFSIQTLRRHLFATLMLVAVIGISYEGRLVYKSFLANTRLSFGYTIDGKDLPAGSTPEIQVDGQPFANGSLIGFGSHELKVDLRDAEPFTKRFWVFGAKNLGRLPLESSKGSLSVTVHPLPATVELERNGIQVLQASLPLKVHEFPAGHYAMIVHRGDYSETSALTIYRAQTTNVQIGRAHV